MEYLQGQPKNEAIAWMNEAAKVAESALCLKAKCGAIIASEGKIIGIGYNAPPLDKSEHQTCQDEVTAGKPKYDRTCCVHAEWRAVFDALKNYPDKIKNSKLYFTRVDDRGEIKKSGQPFCTVCSRMALDVGIDKFLLWHEAGIAEYPTDEYNRLSHEPYELKE